MRLNPRQTGRLVRCIIEKLEESKTIDSRDERAVSEIIQGVIEKDLMLEEQIEKEAEALIRKFSTGYHAEELDYELLFKRAKHELAKKKGVKL